MEYDKRDNLLLLEVATVRLQVLMSEALRLDHLQRLPQPITSPAVDVTTSSARPTRHRVMDDSANSMEHHELLGQCLHRQLSMTEPPASQSPFFHSLCLPLFCVDVSNARITAINQLALSALGNTVAGTEIVG